jgi:helicase required for RNAi-mediated heterochromatin assembly 1
MDNYIFGCPETIQPARQLVGRPQAKPAAANKLNISQEAACKAMITGEFCLVQGPPGSGKTFTSTFAIDSFVKTLKACGHRPTPIIIAAETDDALDHLLEECVRLNLGEVLRLGGQSFSKIIAPRTVDNIRASSGFQRSDPEGQATWKQISAVIEDLFEKYSRDVVCAKDLLDFNLISDEQYQSLLDNAAHHNGKLYHTPDHAIFAWLILSSYSDQQDTEGSCQLNLPLLEKYDDMGDWETDEAVEPRKGHAPDDAKFKGHAPDDAKFKLRGLFLPLNPQHSMCLVPDAIISSAAGVWSNNARKALEICPDLYDMPTG